MTYVTGPNGERLTTIPGAEALALMRSRLQAAIESGLLLMLSGKHLYQHVEIDVSQLFVPREGDGAVFDAKGLENTFDALLRLEWSLTRMTGEPVFLRDRPDPLTAPIPFAAPIVKLYCYFCKRLEPFHPQRTDRIFDGGYPDAPKVRTQIFLVLLGCHSCTRAFTVFMFRRDGVRLSIAGRSPLENVEVPAFLPKDRTDRFFRDAIVAANSGKVLAGIFYLRTMIEQHARIVAGPALVSTPGQIPRADDFLNAYMNSLDAGFRQRAPSLRSTYETLSAAIHEANESMEIFDAARRDIVLHFDLLRLENELKARSTGTPKKD
jgi:hypothetical protein